MELIVSQQGHVSVLEIKGELNTLTSRDLEQRLMDLIAQDHIHFVLNCSELNYISSAGLRVLVVVGKHLERFDGRLVIAAMQGQVAEVFDISGVSSLFPIYPALVDAINSF